MGAVIAAAMSTFPLPNDVAVRLALAEFMLPVAVKVLVPGRTAQRS